jgi:hypothetical protein
MKMYTLPSRLRNCEKQNTSLLVLETFRLLRRKRRSSRTYNEREGEKKEGKEGVFIPTPRPFSRKAPSHELLKMSSNFN